MDAREIYKKLAKQHPSTELEQKEKQKVLTNVSQLKKMYLTNHQRTPEVAKAMSIFQGSDEDADVLKKKAIFKEKKEAAIRKQELIENQDR